ncbi:hypothetical protein D9M69_480010 [compost metagenome]
MEQRVAGQRGERADQQVGALRAGQLDHAGGLQLALFEQARVLVGGHQAQAREQRHHVDGEGHVEGVAPAPVEEVGQRQAGIQVREQRAGQEEAQRCAQLAQHGVPAALVGRCVQRQQRRQAIPRAAQRQALGKAEDGQQHDGREADAGVARQEGDAGGGGAQQEQRDGQLGLAPEAPLDRHRDHGAEGARDEGEREDHEGPEHAFQALLEREEHRREHQHRGDAVDEEVEILGGAADDHADRDLARGDVRMVGVCGADTAFGRVRPRLGALWTDAGRRHLAGWL